MVWCAHHALTAQTGPLTILDRVTVDARKLRPCLLILQMLIAVLFANQRLDLSTEEPQPRVPMRGADLIAELASADRRDDLVLRERELLARRFVAERRAFALPLTLDGRQRAHV